MITLREAIPRKLSGITSIFVDAPYNEKIIKVLHSLDIAVFDKKTSLWEIQCSELFKFVDEVIYIDDVQLILKEDNIEHTVPKTRILSYKTKPFDYQLKGIDFGLAHDKWLLLDAPGLGKTLQLIYLAEELYAQGEIEHCLIICGINTLKTNWKKEIAKHSSLTCKILGERETRNGKFAYETISKRCEQLKNPIKEFFIITNIESFRNEDMVKAFQKSTNKIGMIVVDEIHKCKSKKSHQGANLLKLDAKYKVAATGTLLLNSPVDAYVPLVWIGADHATLTNFKQQYCEMGYDFHITGYKNLEQLKEEIDVNSLRRTKDLLDLPPKTIYNEYVDMSDSHEKFYDDIKKGVKEEADKIDLKTNSVLALVTRLRQATACPSILTTHQIDSSKIDRCVDLTEEILSDASEKVVIFSTFKEPCFILADKLKEYNPIVITGDSKVDIEKAKDDFQTNNTNRVLIATWQKMGTGQTLTRASYCIFIDTPWTAAVFEQACDRIYRIGTKKPVFIYNLICSGTIDEKVAELLDMKKSLSDYMIDDKLDDKAMKILEKYIKDL